jgi:O-antigen/teichoic acid export membrane protein
LIQKSKSESSRNVLTLITGTTIAQAIPVAISPILTRIYTPEDFGVFALFVAITAMFGSIVSGRYELSIMLPKKDEDAINIFALGFIITSFISLVLLVIVLLFNEYLTNLLNNDEISVWLYFVPVSVFIAGIFNLLNYFNIRKRNYKDIASATIVKSVISAVIQLSIGFMKNGVSGLITGQIISQIFANMKLFKNIIKDKILLSKIKKIKMIALAKKYKKFPKFDIWSGLLNTASLHIAILMLSSFFGIIVVGFFSLSHRFISMPMALIGSSIGQVFYQQSNKVKNDKESLKELTFNTYKKLFKLGLIPFTIIMFYADYIFAFVFGGEWVVAGEYAQILSIWILFVFISSPLSNILLTLEMQKEALYFNILIFASRVVVLIIGGLVLNDAYLTILIYGISGALFWIFWTFYILKTVGVSVSESMIYTFKYLLLSVLFFGTIRIYL